MKPKKISYRLIDRNEGAGTGMYALLDRLVADHHDDLTEARIALAWNTAWKPDPDGRCTLGKCRKATDLDRELAAYDFVIILRRDFWEHDKVTELQRTALLDHELMHAATRVDKDGEPVVDERGRPVYRIRKHDIEEFGAIVARYGLWKRDLQWFVSQVPAQPSLEEPRDNEPPPPTDGDGPTPARGPEWWNA